MSLSIFMFFIFVLIIILNVYKSSSWNENHPKTLDEYLKENPKSKTPNGISCANCGSRSFRNYGVSSPTDHRRLITCNSCSSHLYHAK